MSLKEYYLIGYIHRSWDEPVRSAIVENMMQQIPATAKVTYSGYNLPDAIHPDDDAWIIVYQADKGEDTHGN